MDQFWLDTARTAVKESVASLEEAAKQLIGAVTLVEGIYFAAVSWSDMKTIMAVQGWMAWLRIALFVSPIVLWLACLFFGRAGLHPRDLPDQPQLPGPGRAVPPGSGSLQAPQSEAGSPGPPGRLRPHAGGGGLLPAPAGRAGISAASFPTSSPASSSSGTPHHAGPALDALSPVRHHPPVIEQRLLASNSITFPPPSPQPFIPSPGQFVQATNPDDFWKERPCGSSTATTRGQCTSGPGIGGLSEQPRCSLPPSIFTFPTQPPTGG